MYRLKSKNKTIKMLLLSILLVSCPSFAKEKEKSFTNMEAVSSYQISNIDFIFEDRDKGIIEIISKNLEFSNVNINKLGNSFVIELKDTFLPKNLARTMIVKEFDTTIDEINSYMVKNNTFIKIKTKELSAIETIQSEDSLNIIIKRKEVVKEDVNASNYGLPLSVEFKDIDIRDLLRVISSYTEMNIITSDSVKGNITISFESVPFEHALEVILQSKGLEKRITNNIIYIAPASEITKLEEDRLTAKTKLDNLSSLESKFFQIKYAKAKDLELIATSMITERGKIMIDERTNNLIVKDTLSSLKVIGSAINKLDIPITQVLIEARIVIAKKTKSQELGIKWGGTFFDGKNYIGSDYSDVINHYTSDEYKTDNETQVSERPMVDLGGMSSNAASISLGIATSTALLDMELSALEADGDGEVIARPKIVTADKKTASIKSGTQIPYQESSGASGATTTSFKDAVMLLEATPQITPDGRIIMDLKITQDSVGALTESGPSIDTTQIETQVLVNNGETIVLGGIFKSEVLKSVSKVPLLGDLPLIGKLFQNKVDSESKTELLIFITPKLIESDIFSVK